MPQSTAMICSWSLADSLKHFGWAVDTNETKFNKFGSKNSMGVSLWASVTTILPNMVPLKLKRLMGEWRCYLNRRVGINKGWYQPSPWTRARDRRTKTETKNRPKETLRPKIRQKTDILQKDSRERLKDKKTGSQLESKTERERNKPKYQ